MCLVFQVDAAAGGNTQQQVTEIFQVQLVIAKAQHTTLYCRLTIYIGTKWKEIVGPCRLCKASA